MKCIVCHNFQVEVFSIIDKKKYWKCNFCEAKFLDKRNYLSYEKEKKHYSKHENEINDVGYRNFLSKLSKPLIKKLLKTDKGLDFGCGHGPVLAYMLKSQGFEVDIFDPFFFNNREIFAKKYDFITCTEVAEHFFDPFNEFKVLDDLLKPKGCLALMTCFLTSDNLFKNWYYRRDPTHVVFYKERTFEVISSQRNWKYEIKSKDVVFLSKL